MTGLLAGALLLAVLLAAVAGCRPRRRHLELVASSDAGARPCRLERRELDLERLERRGLGRDGREQSGSPPSLPPPLVLVAAEDRAERAWEPRHAARAGADVPAHHEPRVVAS